MSLIKADDYYFRVKYRKLDTVVKLSNNLRCDMKFEVDLENELVFALYPVFETLSDSEMVGDEWQALDEGIALIRKPYPEDRNGYYELIRERVQIGADAYFVGGHLRIAEVTIIEVLSEI